MTPLLDQFGSRLRMFTLPYPPPLNNLHTVARGRKILTDKGRNYKDTASKMAIAQGVRPMAGDIHVTIQIYRPRKSGDLDNFFKAPFDAVKGIAWADDGQVKKITAELGDDKNNPRVEMMVEPYLTQEEPR